MQPKKVKPLCYEKRRILTSHCYLRLNYGVLMADQTISTEVTGHNVLERKRHTPFSL